MYITSPVDCKKAKKGVEGFFNMNTFYHGLIMLSNLLLLHDLWLRTVDEVRTYFLNRDVDVLIYCPALAG